MLQIHLALILLTRGYTNCRITEPQGVAAGEAGVYLSMDEDPERRGSFGPRRSGSDGEDASLSHGRKGAAPTSNASTTRSSSRRLSACSVEREADSARRSPGLRLCNRVGRAVEDSVELVRDQYQGGHPRDEEEAGYDVGEPRLEVRDNPRGQEEVREEP